MVFRQITSPGLSHHSYYCADRGDALVVDPRRDVDIYVDIAAQEHHRIRYILETHRNEDYVIGSTALRAQTDAEILHGHNLNWGYGNPICEGEEVGVGRLKIRALETPGHTPESMTYALIDSGTSDNPVLAFTGDVLFIGDTGRTDLLGEERKRELSERLYESIFTKILPLGDGVILFPGHGGGSVCGGAISDRDHSSLGFERLSNPLLKAADRKDFIRSKLAEKHVRPPYFTKMERWNLQGDAPIYQSIPFVPALSPAEFGEQMKRGIPAIDTRMPQAFAGGHIPGSYNIWLEGLSSYLPWIVSPDSQFLLVLPENVCIREVMRILLRIGYDNIAGYLMNGFGQWQNEGREIGKLGTIDTITLKDWLKSNRRVHILDVRKPDEWDGGTILGALQIFVGDLENDLRDVPGNGPVIVMCSVGHRGSIGASILARHGIQDVYNYLGGYNAWKKLS